jgi:uncharacterized protein involved in exopolysaccharide biosynthesis
MENPNQTVIVVRRDEAGRAITLDDLRQAVRESRKPLIAVPAILVAFAILFQLVAPRVYRGEAVVLAVTADSRSSGLASLASQLGALSSLGFLGGLTGGSSEHGRALAVLRSRGFAVRVIEREHLLRELYADRWDTQADRWQAASEVPTIEDGYLRLSKRHYRVLEDEKTHLIRVRVDWPEPTRAAELANGIVAQLNDEIRQLDVSESQQAIRLLEAEIAATGTVEIRQTLFQLLQTHVNRVVVARARPQYALSVIDAASPSDDDKPASPRAVITLAATLIAVVLIDIGLLWLALMRKVGTNASRAG